MKTELTYIFSDNKNKCYKLKILTDNPNRNVMEMRLNLLKQLKLK